MSNIDTSTPSYPSIHEDIAPLETGGVVARDGFLFQDHVAAKWCLEMLSANALVEVRCESQDDVLLIWLDNGCEVVEFVQVKGALFDQLWSVAKLCERRQPSSSNGSNRAAIESSLSIIEKLIANDRFFQFSRFRIVTRQRVNSQLACLVEMLGSPARISYQEELSSLQEELQRKLPNLRSPKGNGVDYFVANVKWDVEYDIDAIERRNHLEINVIAESRGLTLLSSQISYIYEKLLSKVQNAASMDWRANVPGKKITRIQFELWFNTIVEEAKSAIISSEIAIIEKKIEHANLPHDYIGPAVDALEAYRTERLTPRYYDSSGRQSIDREVYAELHELLAQFDAGCLGESNANFLVQCQDKLRELRDNLPYDPKPSKAYMYGCMYFITGRCEHRFSRVDI